MTTTQQIDFLETFCKVWEENENSERRTKFLKTTLDLFCHAESLPLCSADDLLHDLKRTLKVEPEREFLFLDHSGRGFSASKKHSEIGANVWDFEQEDDNGLTFGDFLNTSEVGENFLYDNTTTITRVK